MVAPNDKPKKLYEVTVERIVYVYAEDEGEAASIGESAVEDDGCFDAGAAREVTHRDWPLAADWNDNCLVYGPDEDVTIGSLLQTLPESKSFQKLKRLHESLEPGKNPLPKVEAKPGDAVQDDEGKWSTEKDKKGE